MTNILVTGGSGFMGQSIVAGLMDPASPLKANLIRVYDTLEYTGQGKDRIEFVKGDIRDLPGVTAACRAMDVVIHSAAIVDWGTKSDEEVYSVNVHGTENVLSACREQKVRALVFTSSLDAVFGGKPLVNIDESFPYPEKHPNSYCRSKYLSEKLVLSCKRDDLSACVIRPSDVYGEGDPFHIGSLINMAKGGFYVRLGNGKTKCQHVYVANIAHAHLLAARALLDGNPAVHGNAYFITDGPGTNFFKFYDSIVEAAGYKIWPKNLWLPRGFAMFLGFVSESAALLVRPFKKYMPKMSRFAVIYTCSDFTFSAEKARKDFGYVPRYTAEEAFEKTVSYYREEKG